MLVRLVTRGGALWVVFQDIYVVVNVLSQVIFLFPSTMSK